MVIAGKAGGGQVTHIPGLNQESRKHSVFFFFFGQPEK